MTLPRGYEAILGAPDLATLIGKTRRGPHGCWLWQGASDHQGYGLHWWKGRLLRAHRLAFVASGGRIPPGKIVCHRCDTPQCINPQHLFVGTYRDNTHDASGKKRMALGLRNGAYTQPATRRIGSLNGRALLTDKAVRAIRIRFATTKTTKARLALRYRISETTIHKIINRWLWKHVK